MVRITHTIRRLAAITLALFVVGITFPTTLLAKHSKHGHRHKRHRWSKLSAEKNRNLAIEFLRQNSPALSQLANLPPVTPSESDRAAVVQAMLSQSEDTSDDTALADSTDDVIQGPEDAVELEKYDDVKVDINEFRKVWLSYVEHAGDSTSAAPQKDMIDKRRVMATIMNWLGTPYWYGGTSNRGIDCSGFTRMVYDSATGMLLPRSAHDQYLVGTPVDDRDLKFGDLVFFHTRRRPYVSHVGIYLGDNLFAQSSSRYGVTISSLQSTYYANHFIEGRRFIP